MQWKACYRRCRAVVLKLGSHWTLAFLDLETNSFWYWVMEFFFFFWQFSENIKVDRIFSVSSFSSLIFFFFNFCSDPPHQPSAPSGSLSVHEHFHTINKWARSKQHQQKILASCESQSQSCLAHRWQPTPVFLPGESHGHRSLAGRHGPWGRRESDTTEATQQPRALLFFFPFPF